MPVVPVGGHLPFLLWGEDRLEPGAGAVAGPGVVVDPPGVDRRRSSEVLLPQNIEDMSPHELGRLALGRVDERPVVVSPAAVRAVPVRAERSAPRRRWREAGNP